ncbi:methyltransferase [Sphingomonas sp. Leaf23]|nr:methyltransferase [Sphingomonas sp. Leaf23]
MAVTGAALTGLVTTGHDFAVVLAKLGTALLFGGLIGLERQIRQRTAGLRTMALGAVGAAAFVHLGGRLTGVGGMVHVVAYVVSGIGFLGAGIIMKEGAQVRGLNTAATLWSSAAIGAFCGAGLLPEAAGVTVIVLVGNTMLRPLVNYINRQPVDAATTEAVYRAHVVCLPERVTLARDLLADGLESIGYPVQSIDVVTDTDDSIEIAATLIPTTADPEALERFCTRLRATEGVVGATWTVSAIL